MKILSNSVVLSLLLVGCGNGEPQEERLSRNEKHDEAPSLALSEEELERQIAMAENGNAEARLKLEWHYSTRGDMERYRYWLEEGVARMDVSSMQRLALFLSLEQGGGDCKRAMQILEEGLRLDPPETTRELMEMDLQRLRHERVGVPPCGVGLSN
ncbi:hypothetical protein [Stenotrophomonas geniculata]|uniref:Lipoprotein n=1 Tax=Stenotrophomonas maltophilia TaxID=40324 RepID=A0AA41CCH8_STEMA|nr:hypothetical protein [Stenotrophomonas geniculata]MBH1640579.1 hypothetical protein [Stenotrophomonas maltophilia]MCF3476917.1 hypothetical protein [Stenotrophomonas maltophilia]MCI1064721.1 hypothetical protein [Stenotrophomonas maltophilia]MCI1105841.1 hypothetical protein [Stenotrophomonas maltophilia]MDC7800444.1 hypothetical protein [Stenotrophomonas geniculata]